MLVTRLTDAPFPTDQVQSVDIYVVRVDARTADVAEDEANESMNDDAEKAGWKTIATPNAVIDLLSLRGGNSVVIGQAVLPAGNYAGLRVVIDESKSSVTLKDGTVLNGGSTPGIKFPSAGQSGLKVLLAEPVPIIDGTETELLIDFDIEHSFVMRGNTITQNGLLFKPVIKGSITNLATTNSRVRLANATDSSLTLLQSGTALAGSSALAFGAASACSSINAATPDLTITRGTANTLLAGFAPTLTAGHPATFVAYPGANAGDVKFATLSNDFLPTAGQAGLRVFNATAIATAFDIFVTDGGAPLGTATFANLAAGDSTAWAGVPATATEIRLTATGTTTPILLDLTSQTLAANHDQWLIIAPPAMGQTAPRAFLVPSC